MAETANPSDERELVARFLHTRDATAFTAIYRRHAPMLYRVAWRMTRDAGRAAEIVQEIWIRAIERIETFRWESSLATWLVGVAMNCVHEEIRREQARSVRGDPVQEPAERPLAIVERIDLEDAIASLTDGYREILLLHDVEGFTHEEIATALGIEPGTSRSQLARARAALRRWMEPSTRRVNE